MTNHDEWNEFLNNMTTVGLEEYKKSKEYEYLDDKLKEMDNLLCNELTEDQKICVDEVMFEIGVASDREKEILYKQGIKDCIFILKELKVLT